MTATAPSSRTASSGARAVSAIPQSGERTRTAGDYELLRRLGSGAMGEVWLGRHQATGTLSAVKLLHEAVAQSPRVQRFFARERRVVALLQHPHIVSLHALGPGFIATAYIDGSDLVRRMQTPIEPRLAVLYTLQIASALSHAHANGVIHRDVKPSNILVDRRGNAYLADFGLAAIVDDDDGGSAEGRVGTPAYMAPEQKRGGDVGPEADQYALARTLTALLADAPLATDGDPLAQLPASAPASLVATLRRATAADPRARFASVTDFAIALGAADLGGTEASVHLAPEVRVRAPFAWCAGSSVRRTLTPEIACADFDLGELERSGLLPREAVRAFRESTGYANVAWTMYGHEGRLGPISSDAALARATDLVVVMHGAFCSRADWHHVATAICRDNAQAIVLVPDMYGSGETRFVDDADPSQLRELRGHADMILAWLELLSVRDMSTVLVGHSLSGVAMLPLTDEELGERVSRVAITPSIPEAANARYRFGASIVRGALSMPAVRKALGRLMLQTIDLSKSGPEASQRMYRQFVKSPAWFVKRFATDYMTVPLAPATSLRRCAILLADDDPVCSTVEVRRILVDHGFPPELIQRLIDSGHYPHVKEVGDAVAKGRTLADLTRAIDSMLTTSRDGTPVSTRMESTQLGDDSNPTSPATAVG